ncbi:SRPBCC domain-containing protein [Steroidobacter sp.]|uniref:SRPBCC domain-containing protein n=1 Tax=Steroidobacter sp. TaxID=1978227 RepID=UPI0025FD3C7E|nr:SRPBCC domain-containing protein [Steroidobacter sp.]
MTKPQLHDQGDISTASCVTFTRLLPGPIERVWSYIAEPEKLPAWFGEGATIEARQGGKVSLMNGHIRGVVTQWLPPHKLVYTWNVFEPAAADDAASAYPESYPTFELEPYSDGVLLTFKHFPVLERFVAQNAMGWHTMLDIMSAGVKNEPIADRSVYFKKNAALYGVDLAQLTK